MSRLNFKLNLNRHSCESRNLFTLKTLIREDSRFRGNDELIGNDGLAGSDELAEIDKT